MNWDGLGYPYGIDSHKGDMLPVVSDATGYCSYYNGPGSFKASMYDGDSIIGRTLVVYERRDDFGILGTVFSQQWGSAGEPIACCIIERFCEPGEDGC